MAYGMVCDHCGCTLKIDDNIIKPYATVTVQMPGKFGAKRKYRYCEDCTTNYIISPADDIRLDFTDRIDQECGCE